MQIKVKYVYRTSFCQPAYQQFNSARDLSNFLNRVDFMAPRLISRLSPGLPQFQLGTVLEVTLNGYLCRSDIKWGPVFLVARNIDFDAHGRMIAEIPSDSSTSPKNGIISRELAWRHVNPADFSAILNVDNLHQLWPYASEKSRTELCKFFNVTRPRHKKWGHSR